MPAFLRGSSDAIMSNKAIMGVLQQAAEGAGLPKGALQLVEDTSRETANAMLKLNRYLDVLIPRGGAGLIQSVVENATVPVIETGVGNCHVYVDDERGHRYGRGYHHQRQGAAPRRLQRYRDTFGARGYRAGISAQSSSQTIGSRRGTALFW